MVSIIMKTSHPVKTTATSCLIWVVQKQIVAERLKWIPSLHTVPGDKNLQNGWEFREELYLAQGRTGQSAQPSATNAGAYTFPDQWKHEKATQTLSGQLSTFPWWMGPCANSPFCLAQVPSILSIGSIKGQWPSLLNPRACLSLVNGNKG